MNKGNLILLAMLLVLAVAWGVVYWLFFAENVVSG